MYTGLQIKINLPVTYSVDVLSHSREQFLHTLKTCDYRYQVRYIMIIIDLITVSDIILTGRQSGQKVHACCLCRNPMATNFFPN